MDENLTDYAATSSFSSSDRSTITSLPKVATLRWVQAVRWDYENGQEGIDGYLKNKTVWAQL